MNRVLATLLVTVIFAQSLYANIVISEVSSTSSGGNYGADWFELTNTGANSISIAGWKVDDSTGSAGAGSAVVLDGVTSIAPGQSAVFIEADPGSTTVNDFIAAWFGGSAPAGLAIGTYSGSGLGFSSGGDGVFIFNDLDVEQFSVSFGAGTLGFTFDNSEAISGAISTLSQVGVNGAFTSFDGSEVGSPGISAVPEPSSGLVLSIASIGGLLIRRRRAPNA